MKGLRLVIQIVLLGAALGLTYMVYTSIMEPVNYEKIKSDRQQIIVEHLMNIKELQIEYKNINGKYTASFDSLKDFYLNGKMPVVLKVGTNDTLTEEKALELGYITRDTSYVLMKDTLFKNVEKFNIETIDIVPFTKGKVKFEMNAGMVDKSNFQVPVFEVTCLMEDYLKDIKQKDLLDNEIIILKEDNKFPGLRLGAMDEPSTDGNWQ